MNSATAEGPNLGTYEPGPEVEAARFRRVSPPGPWRRYETKPLVRPGVWSVRPEGGVPERLPGRRRRRIDQRSGERGFEDQPSGERHASTLLCSPGDRAGDRATIATRADENGEQAVQERGVRCCSHRRSVSDHVRRRRRRRPDGTVTADGPGGTDEPTGDGTGRAACIPGPARAYPVEVPGRSRLGPEEHGGHRVRGTTGCAAPTPAGETEGRRGGSTETGHGGVVDGPRASREFPSGGADGSCAGRPVRECPGHAVRSWPRRRC